MRWHEITLYTREETVELVADAFRELGAGGVAIEESGTLNKQRDTSLGQWYEFPLNDIPEGEAIVQAYFADHEDIPALIEQLEERIQFIREELEYDVGKATITFREVHEEDWANSWKQYYKPLRITERLTIKPTWESYEPEHPDELILEMDPGMAFGTGTHPTTSLCLKTLEQVVVPGDDVIDVGTGSGVLAIAAAKLGARHVLALDLDPVAVSSAAGNVELNGLSEQVTVQESDLLGILQQTNEAKPLGVTMPVRLVVANILAEIILLFVDDVYAALQPGGTYVASGIYKNKEEDVERGLLAAGFVVERKMRDEDWIAFIARKP